MKGIISGILLVYGSLLWAQHGVGTANPNTSAALDIAATNKGLLIPRVGLNAANTLAPITGTAGSAHNGMLVYNTNNTLGGEGLFYYDWNPAANSGAWTRLNTGTPATPNTLYTADGTLTANRTVSLGTRSLNMWPLFINGANNGVGINNSNPGFPLEVTGAGIATLVAAGFAITQNGALPVRNNSNAFPLVKFNGGVWSTNAFLVDSDQRVKSIIGKSDAAKDLRTLAQISITDYRYKDSLSKGNKTYKKVIAQQLEKVYPQAVQTSTAPTYVPDIYAPARVAKVGEGVYDFTFTQPVQPEAGVKKLRLHLKDGTEKTARFISQPAAAVLRLVVEGFTPDPEMFVYGSAVYDLRTVDYDGLTCLNLSATQALDQKLKRARPALEALSDENKSLKASLAVFRQRLKAFEANLATVQENK